MPRIDCAKARISLGEAVCRGGRAGDSTTARLSIRPAAPDLLGPDHSEHDHPRRNQERAKTKLAAAIRRSVRDQVVPASPGRDNRARHGARTRETTSTAQQNNVAHPSKPTASPAARAGRGDDHHGRRRSGNRRA